MRVGLFNVKYSPNLGDGLLSESLEAELAEIVPGLTTVCFDLAGRHGYSEGGRLRGTALKLLQRCPSLVRHAAVRMILGRSLRGRLRPAWKRGLDAVDVAVVGGGNLFGDTDLNFPLKVDGAFAEIRAAGIPAAVFGVGVADNWSPMGEGLFRKALITTRLIYLSVRDERSAEIWKRRLTAAGVEEARIVRDPGLLVSRHVPGQTRKNGLSPQIGIGLTHPVALSYHADEPTAPEAELTPWYLALLRKCLDRGWRVSVFTNGSPEDESYLNQVRSACSQDTDLSAVVFEPRFSTPSALASYISGLDLMMAHRLHANIAAYSYAVPHLGFSWDAKLKSFLEDVERGAFLCPAGLTHVETVVALAEQTMGEGIDRKRHRQVIAAARADVSSLANALLAAKAAPPVGKLVAS